MVRRGIAGLFLEHDLVRKPVPSLIKSGADFGLKMLCGKMKGRPWATLLVMPFPLASGEPAC